MPSDPPDPDPDSWEHILTQVGEALRHGIDALERGELSTAKRWFRLAIAANQRGERVSPTDASPVDLRDLMAHMAAMDELEDTLVGRHEYDLSTLTIQQNPNPGE